MKGITFLTSEITNSPNNPIFDFIQKLNEGLFGMITTLISNIGVILPIILFFVLLICFLGTFKSKTKRISKLLLYEFIKNKKYIEGLFVELNNTKEYLRYFIYGKKWKIRIIHKYNALFNDEYGKHLKLIFGDKINLTLNKHQNLTRISDIISETLDLIQKVNSRQIQCSEEFRDTEILFEIHGRHYIERLNELKLYIEFSKKRSIVLTGSAGNGKTNILCNFVEMLINKKDICIFLNSSNVEDDIENYFRNQLSTLNLTKNKWFDIFWIIENIICFIRRKYIYIVIDAINENGNEEFYKSLPKFINKILKYPMVKIITSCRSEYFDLKFRKVLIEQINYPVLCYDILQGTYSSVAKERLYDNYCKAFNFNGTVAQEVKEKLFNQLLLMRMFFEVNEGNNKNFNTLNKYEIFQKFIDNTEYISFVNQVIEKMYATDNYISVRLSTLTNEPLSYAIKNFIDESVLLSRKLVFNKDTIIESEDEELYFIFDEMRDYCVAKFVLNRFCNHANVVDNEQIIQYISKLTHNKMVCTEGVLNYIYWYYRSLNDYKMCEKLMAFMKENDDVLEKYDINQMNGLRSWGLKVIFENNEQVLMEFEKKYIKYIMIKNPGNELQRLFYFLVNQEILKGLYNLSTYLEILGEIHETNQFVDVIKHSISSWHGGISHANFIGIDKKLSVINQSGCERFRIFVAIYLKLFYWNDDYEIKNYFNVVCNSIEINKFIKDNIPFFKECEQDEH